MRISEDEEIEEYSYDFNDSAYKMRDIVFNIMLNGVTSITGIAMELNRQGIWGKEWRVGLLGWYVYYGHFLLSSSTASLKS